MLSLKKRKVKEAFIEARALRFDKVGAWLTLLGLILFPCPGQNLWPVWSLWIWSRRFRLSLWRLWTHIFSGVLHSSVCLCGSRCRCLVIRCTFFRWLFRSFCLRCGRLLILPEGMLVPLAVWRFLPFVFVRFWSHWVRIACFSPFSSSFSAASVHTPPSSRRSTISWGMHTTVRPWRLNEP